MIFENIKSITIPEGEVKRILYGSVVLWQKLISKIVNFIDTLVIQDGAERNIESLIQYGKCEQNETPTPSVPIDIKCNNGTLGIISEGVPEEYIRLEYLQSSGTQYIDTGIALNYATQKIEQTATVQYTESNSNRELMGANGYGFFGKSASNKLESATGSNLSITENALVKNTVSLITNPNNNNQVTFIVNSHQYDSSASTLVNNNYACYIFALGGRDNAPASFFCHARIYEFTITLDNVIVSHLLPVRRRSDGVLGLYDTVGREFKTNDGTGTFIAGKTIGQVGAIGTDEVITISGANLLDPTTVPNENFFISRMNGNEVVPSAAGGTFRHSDYIPIVSGETYYFGITPFQASTAGVAWYSEESTRGYISGLSGTQLKSADMKVTAPNSATHVRFSWRIDEDYDTDWEHSVYFCVDGGIDRFVPYTVQTANAEDLLGLGDVVDEQDIISGEVTRKVGVKILDGTEEWTTDTYGGYRRMVLQEVLNASGDTLPVTCSHYASRSAAERQQPNSIFIASSGKLVIYVDSTQNINTVAEFNTWLANQYAAGTPVTILYSLAEETAETTTPQTIAINDTTTISVNNNYISNIGLKVDYYVVDE